MNYDFKNSLTDVRSVVHLIGMHGDDLIGLELGVDRAQSFCTLLQACPNIKHLTGIDNWQPYTDYLREIMNLVLPTLLVKQRWKSLSLWHIIILDFQVKNIDQQLLKVT